MPVTSRSLRAVCVTVACALLLHIAQVAMFGHDLVRVFDGHGLELLPGVLLAPSPALLLATLTLALGLAMLVVLVARLLSAAPRTGLAGPACLTGSRSGIAVHAQMLATSRFGRAPPSLLI